MDELEAIREPSRSACSRTRPKPASEWSTPTAVSDGSRRRARSSQLPSPQPRSRIASRPVTARARRSSTPASPSGAAIGWSACARSLIVLLSMSSA
ncbi:hypothetical protein [Clavibacter tessellarius]|uniref:hypothetical protein n=1 Tax=Clavibacter tessellarius TaxID=31965 RepID=UPI0039BFA5E3